MSALGHRVIRLDTVRLQRTLDLAAPATRECSGAKDSTWRPARKRRRSGLAKQRSRFRDRACRATPSPVRSTETKVWIPFLLLRWGYWLFSRWLPEPFPWHGLHRPSAVSDCSRQLESPSLVCSFPSPQSHPSSTAEGSPWSIQGQSEHSPNEFASER
jgi:hypothetical protein